MYSIQFSIKTTACNCQSQHLICPGEVCEVCMGRVGHSEHETSTNSESWFSESYFEELEDRLEAGLTDAPSYRVSA